MERWLAYEKEKFQIEHIDRFTGGNQEITIFFSDKKRVKYALHFDLIIDFRYTVEDTFCHRAAQRPWTESEQSACVYVVEDSDYLKFFKEQSAGIFPIDGIRHFIVFDAIDTAIELLAEGNPVLTEVID
ncbi:MAG: hypothetical protein LBK61_00890 [Spirochaetaceae bacterium]|jgi:hypothetical protein|nr:hypothetical protein [Spirochaetaceae bacterium]